MKSNSYNFEKKYATALALTLTFNTIACETRNTYEMNEAKSLELHDANQNNEQRIISNQEVPHQIVSKSIVWEIILQFTQHAIKI